LSGRGGAGRALGEVAEGGGKPGMDTVAKVRVASRLRPWLPGSAPGRRGRVQLTMCRVMGLLLDQSLAASALAGMDLVVQSRRS